MILKRIFLGFLCLLLMPSIMVEAGNYRGAGIKTQAKLPFEENYLSNGSKEDIEDFSNAASFLNEALGLNLYFVKYDEFNSSKETIQEGQLNLIDEIDVYSDGNSVVCFSEIVTYEDLGDGNYESVIHPVRWQYGAKAKEILGERGIRILEANWKNRFAEGTQGSFMTDAVNKSIEEINSDDVVEDTGITQFKEVEPAQGSSNTVIYFLCFITIAIAVVGISAGRRKK